MWARAPHASVVLVLVLHARCVVEALASGVAPASLRCPVVNCGAQHPRRDALEAAGKADSSLRDRAARMPRGTTGDEDLRSWGISYGWDQNSQGVGPPLDSVFVDGLGQRLATGKNA